MLIVYVKTIREVRLHEETIQYETIRSNIRLRSDKHSKSST